MLYLQTICYMLFHFIILNIISIILSCMLYIYPIVTSLSDNTTKTYRIGVVLNICIVLSVMLVSCKITDLRALRFVLWFIYFEFVMPLVYLDYQLYYYIESFSDSIFFFIFLVSIPLASFVLIFQSIFHNLINT